MSGVFGVVLRKAGDRKLADAAPVKVVVPDAPALNQASDPTIRDIALKGQPSNSFYLAANQGLVNSLKHMEGPSGAQRSLWHTFHFKNMVATIVLECANRTPSETLATLHSGVLDRKISYFNGLTKLQQIKLLDMLWTSCYRREVPSTRATSMIDGEASTESGEGLPSSLRPKAGGAFFTMLDPGPVRNAWKRYRIGFRVDGGKGVAGSSRDDLARIAATGTYPLQKRPDLAVLYVQKYYHEHPCCQNTDLYVGYQNRDLYNESGTCVARSLLGATAFPYRDSQNNTDGLKAHLGGNLQYQYLFAVDCSNELGVDTEAVQKGMGNHSLWRPGEKAFPGLPANRILAWTRLVKMGQPAGGGGIYQTGWSFAFVDSTWTWLKTPSKELQDYLTAELAAWAPGVTYNIPDKYDFQVAPPPKNK
jgi:hypothetical protein